MEGIFKGWIPGKTFGFIIPDGGGTDVFVHQSAVSNPQSLRNGARVSYDVEESEKGSVAVNVESVDPVGEVQGDEERHTGRVKMWSERGFGFVENDLGIGDVFVHYSSLPPSENGYLSEGDIIEFSILESHKGFVAKNIQVVGWTKPSYHIDAFADMGGPGWLENLAGMAEDEPWEYRHSKAPEPYPILRSYIKYTFRRLEEMEDGVSIAEDGSAASFNTGLVTPNQEDIYALFYPNPRPERQPWRLKGFRKASDWDLVNNFGSNPPPLANYFDDPSVLLYDRRCELFINIDHVMENIDRFPDHLQKNQYVARQLLISAEATTKKRVYRNYKAAIPQYYRDHGGQGLVQLLLPICLENPAVADLALVVSKSESGDAYRGSTVLTLDMAYNNARLLARPDTEWLQP